MPLGFERINAQRKQPNDHINFVKPLDGPDKAFAQDFLERIAAICNPIMKKHHIYIMSLEEYEPNSEFVGRNFNAGEVIQLVLKTPFTGHWLPFRYVQMVMIHELSHCKQMNHSKEFWKVRNGYAIELRALWERGYTGEGMWSRGVTLVSGQYDRANLDGGEVLPENLCGGTFRTSGKRKRKAKNGLSHKERRAGRIAKKFGTSGITLGADEEIKASLEKGKKNIAKPRVAGSARGRELRAAAAIARFQTQKEQTQDEQIQRELATQGEEESTESDYEGEDDKNETNEEAIDINGKKLLDRNGRNLIKTCEGADKEDIDARDELLGLRAFWFPSKK